jgi:hypothetical protein
MGRGPRASPTAGNRAAPAGVCKQRLPPQTQVAGRCEQVTRTGPRLYPLRQVRYQPMYWPPLADRLAPVIQLASSGMKNPTA